MVKTVMEQQKVILQNTIDRKKKNYPYEIEIEVEVDNCEFGESELCYLLNGPAIYLSYSDEKFKNIAGYEGKYLISNYKRIYSEHSNKFLKISDFFDIGRTISLSKKGDQKKYLIKDLYEEHFK